MTNFEKLVSYLPDIYKKENNLKCLEIVAKSYDNFDGDLATLQNVWLLTDAQGKYLDIIGANVGIARGINQNDEIYRRRIKLIMYNIYFIPILDNFINFIEGIMGYKALNIIEGWRNLIPESALLSIDVVVPAGETQALLTDLERIYSAGVRIKWNELQEVYAMYEMIGDVNDTGLQDIFKGTERSVIPIQFKIYAPNEQMGEQNNTGTTEIYTENSVLGGI